MSLLPWTVAGGVAVLVLAVVGVARRLDVRLVLFLAAFALGAMAGNLAPVVRTFLSTLSSEQFVVPICSAMGFAYVLRQTSCDLHLVQLLIRPVRKLRLFLIPGTVLVGFLVNIPIISQAGTAVTIGPIIIPLLQAARLSPTTTGAALLLGASLGGELFNPGAVEWQTVTSVLGADSTEAIARVTPYLLFHLGLATAIFWWLSMRAEARRQEEEPVEETKSKQEEPPFRVNLLKAAVPLVPLVLLFLVGPPLRFLPVDRSWLIGDREPATMRTEARLIGAAMLLGSVVAAVVSPRRAAESARAFFEGAGYAFTQVISVIVVATCFGKGLEAIGLKELFGQLVGRSSRLLVVCALALPLFFAMLCGSGFASTQSLFALFVEPARQLEMDPVSLGALVSLASSAGRTISPVAPVVLLCATLAGAEPLRVVRRLVVPVVVGVTAVLGVRLLVGR